MRKTLVGNKFVHFWNIVRTSSFFARDFVMESFSENRIFREGQGRDKIQEDFVFKVVNGDTVQTLQFENVATS